MSTAPRILTPTPNLFRTSRGFAVQVNSSWRAQAPDTSMNFDSVGEIIATRRFRFFDDDNHQRTVCVFVGKPEQPDDSSDYFCPFQVIGIGHQQTESARGRDSIQALQSALELIAATLRRLNTELGGRLKWDGERQGELGFS
jgi:hypothetical protein